MLSSKRTFWKDKTKSSRKGPFLSIQFCIYTPTTVEFLDRGQTEHKNSLTFLKKKKKPCIIFYNFLKRKVVRDQVLIY